MKRIALSCSAAVFTLLALWSAASADDPKPIKLLIITGDHGHDWKATTGYFKEFLPKDRIAVDVTETPATDLTPDNLKKYDVLLFNFKDTPKGGPETRWSDANKQAFLGAVRGGKGLVVFHHASSAFLEWLEFERCIAGGWRGQGYHGPKHQFKVDIVTGEHPITKGLPKSFTHEVDELYANSVMFPENEVLATAYSDPKKEHGTGKHEPMVWVKRYGRGRVFVNAMGHDVDAMKGLGFQTLMIRGIEWAATGQVTSQVPTGLASSSPGQAEAQAPRGWGSIRGRFVFPGADIPEPKILVRKGDTNVKDALFCAKQEILSEELVVNRDNRGIRWVAVYLVRPAAIHPDLAKADGELEFGIESCVFKPHMLALRVGQRLKLTNSDPIGHNVKIEPYRHAVFNSILIPAQPGRKTEMMVPEWQRAEALPVRVTDNIHVWMRSWVCVFDHPYFALTDENGAFEIRNVPVGKVTLGSWQETRGYGQGGKPGMEVEVRTGDTTDLGEVKLQF